MAKDQKPEEEYKPLSFEKVQKLLAPLGDKVFVVAEARALLLKAGDKKPGDSLRTFLAGRGMRSIGNTHKAEPAGEDGKLDKLMPTKKYRFKLTAFLPGGKFWIRPIAGYGPGIDVAGIRLDRFGKLVEITPATRHVLEKRDCPVEVITRPDEIAKLQAAAKERAESSGKVFDKRAAVMDALGD